MSKINKDAWDVLLDDEKLALSLSLGHGKSSWQSGEIMNKAHFKYLEIQKRASKFLDIFTNHFEKYGGLIPEDIQLSFSFVEYLQLTMISRKNISVTVREMESNRYLINSTRTKYITRELEKLKGYMEYERESAIDLYNLIMDFDRWNNFRILPISLQEPSAFKRRNKARNKKHLVTITSLPKFSVMKLIEIFHYSGKYSKLYLPVISKYVDNGYQIIPIKNDKRTINKLTEIGLFIFEKQSVAIDFSKLIYDYFFVVNRTCISGQKFWPEFREFISQAVNFKELENIHKSRRYLDSALFDNEDLKLKIKKRSTE